MPKMPCHISDGPPEPPEDWRTPEQVELDELLEDIALTEKIKYWRIEDELEDRDDGGSDLPKL